MGLIQLEKVRPEGITTLYRADINTAVVLAQIETISEAFYNAVNNGLTITIREPTQSQFAALVVTVGDYKERADKAVADLRKLINNLGLTMRDVEFHFDVNQIVFNIEEYAPSAYKQQISYVVADLPA